MPRYAAGPDACGIQLITCPYFEKKGSHAMTILVNNGMLKPGNTVVVTAGVPIGVSGTTNFIKVMQASGMGKPRVPPITDFAFDR